MTTQFQLPLSDLKREWIAESAPIVLQAMRGREFTADDLHGLCDPPWSHNWWGVLCAKLKNKGLLERVGYRQSQRKSANGRVVAVWRVKG